MLYTFKRGREKTDQLGKASAQFKSVDLQWLSISPPAKTDSEPAWAETDADFPA